MKIVDSNRISVVKTNANGRIFVEGEAGSQDFGETAHPGLPYLHYLGVREW